MHTSSSVTDIIKDNKDLEKAYDELWKQIQEIQSKLLPGEELWIGKTKIDSTTKKEDIIKYFTKAISPDDMSKDELIKALQEQERIAKSSTYVANKGSDYEETKKNYYSGEKTDEFKYFSKAPDDSKIEVYWKWTWWGGYYYYTDANGQEVRVDSNTVHSEEQRDDIGHLDLASGSKLDLLPDEEGKVNQTDCVLVSKDLKLGGTTMPKTWSTVRATRRSAWTARSAGTMRVARAAATTSMTAATPIKTPTRAPTTS